LKQFKSRGGITKLWLNKPKAKGNGISGEKRKRTPPPEVGEGRETIGGNGPLSYIDQVYLYYLFLISTGSSNRKPGKYVDVQINNYNSPGQ
jgi:hypothetical protein